MNILLLVIYVFAGAIVSTGIVIGFVVLFEKFGIRILEKISFRLGLQNDEPLYWFHS